MRCRVEEFEARAPELGRSFDQLTIFELTLSDRAASHEAPHVYRSPQGVLGI